MAVGNKVIDACKVIGEAGVRLGNGFDWSDLSVLMSIPGFVQDVTDFPAQIKSMKRDEIQKVGNFFYDLGFLVKDVADELITEDNALVKLNVMLAELAA